MIKDIFYKSYYNSPIGKILIVSNNTHLLGVWIENQKYYLETIEQESILDKETETIIKTKKWLDRYFDLKKPNINELMLEPSGGEFRKRVWKILCEIPYGEVITYGDIAKKIAKDLGKKNMSAQAVGGAVGHNPISIIIPCHRVIGKDGNLTGYAGGIEKKIQLLRIEGIDIDKLKGDLYVRKK